MGIELGSFTGVGGVAIHTVDYSVSDPVGHVVILHGLFEHAARYDHVARGLNEAGFAVHLHDHRGHGRSKGRFGHVDSFRHLVTDVETRVRSVRARNDGRPLLLLGHSMGSLAGYATLIRNRVEIDAWVATGTLMKVGSSIPPVLIPIGRVVSNLAPTLPMEALEADAISRDPVVVAKYLDDPFVFNGKVDAGTGNELLATVDWARPRLGRIEQPSLLLHGSADRLCDVEGAKIALDALGSKEKTLRIYDGLYHEVLNEPEGPEILSEIIDWFKLQLPAVTSAASS